MIITSEDQAFERTLKGLHGSAYIYSGPKMRDDGVLYYDPKGSITLSVLGLPNEKIVHLPDFNASVTYISVANNLLLDLEHGLEQMTKQLEKAKKINQS